MHKKFGLGELFWQALSLIVAVVSIIITVFIAYDVQSSELTVEEKSFYNPIRFAEQSTKDIKLVIDGVPTNSVNLFSFSVSNTGRNPIIPSDYIEPIQISVPDPWQLLAVETDMSSSSTIQLKWTRVSTNTYQMTPTLLNPGDKAEVLLFVNDGRQQQQQASFGERPVVTWAARIVNVSSIRLQKMLDREEASGLGRFYMAVSHDGQELYLFLLTATLMYVVGLVISNRSPKWQGFSLYQISYICFFVTLSYGAADALFDILSSTLYISKKITKGQTDSMV